MNAVVRGSVFTDHHGKCFGQMECSTGGKEAISPQAWSICCAVGVCFHCWLGQNQKHLTHTRTLAKHSIKHMQAHSDKQTWFIPHAQSCQSHAGLNRHANTDRGGKHAGITLQSAKPECLILMFTVWDTTFDKLNKYTVRCSFLIRKKNGSDMLNFTVMGSSSICFCNCFTTQVVPDEVLIQLKYKWDKDNIRQNKSWKIGGSKFQVLCVEMSLTETYSE